MSLETEAVLDRRRLKRRLSTWRVLALGAGVLAIGALTMTGDGLGKSDHIARVSIEGMILEDRDQLKMLRKIAKDKSVKALLLYVNSPGGTTTGGEALFEALREVGAKKPVVAQFGTIATSAAYIAGLGSDHIVARGNSITGSVGVLFQWAEVSELMGKLGVKFNEIKSGNMKAEPSPFKPITPAGKQVAEEMIADSQRWFLTLVQKRRGIETAAVPGLEAGRIFSGRDALKHKMIDEIGGEGHAVKWLVTKRDVPKGLKLVDWKPKDSSDWSWTGRATAALGAVFGIGDGSRIAQLLRGAGTEGMFRLDGLVSVWHPGKN